MKHYNMIFAAALCCVFLTACGSQGGTSEPSAEPETTTAAPVTTVIPSDTECVKTAREADVGEDSEAVYRFPALNFDTEDAKTINEEISDCYTPLLDSIQEQYKAGKAPEYSSIDYTANINDDIISIVITDETAGHVLSYRVYNFNKTTGKRVDNAALLEYLQLDYDSTFERLKQSLQDDYTSKFKYENFKEDYYYQLEMTVGDEAIRQSQLYLNENAELYAICVERASIGDGEFNVVIAVT